jgi:hypothetical protein
VELRLVERRIPATVPLPQRSVSKLSRYYLADPYLRFYYRFIDPNLHLIEQGLTTRLWDKVSGDFRAFVAGTFEELCRAWVLSQARAGALPFVPDVVGSHWATDAQRSPASAGVDVVAINWETKAILLGEAKWGEGLVGQGVIRELVEKAGRVVPGGGEGWRIYYAFFVREGFTDAAREEAAQLGAMLVTLEEMEPGL